MNNRARFIADLVDLLVKVERGMQEFDEPLPSEVGGHLIGAIIAFGKDALPLIHDALVKFDYSNMAFGYLVDLLGSIGDASSVPILIKCHENGNFMTSTAALQALQKLKTNDAYVYMSKLLEYWSEGNKRLINSGFEMVVACQALGEWNDPRALTPLMKAVTIHDPNGLPRVAIEALAKYPEAHDFLTELAEQEPSLKDIISSSVTTSNQKLTTNN